MVELRDGEIVERRRFHVDSRFVGRRIVSYPDIPEKRALVRLALSASASRERRRVVRYLQVRASVPTLAR